MSFILVLNLVESKYFKWRVKFQLGPTTVRAQFSSSLGREWRCEQVILLHCHCFWQKLGYSFKTDRQGGDSRILNQLVFYSGHWLSCLQDYSHATWCYQWILFIVWKSWINWLRRRGIRKIISFRLATYDCQCTEANEPGCNLCFLTHSRGGCGGWGARVGVTTVNNNYIAARSFTTTSASLKWIGTLHNTH